MVIVMIPNNTLQFRYIWHFNKCLQLQAISPPLNLDNFWLYLLGEVVMTQIIKNYYKSPLKVCELKV